MAEEKTSSLTEYLQGPKKKRKKFVTLAFNQNFDPAVIKSIEGFLREKYAAFALAFPTNGEDLKRQGHRLISLLLIDDEFESEEKLVDLIKFLKQRRHQSTMPVLFFTRSPKHLIEIYNKNLQPYHETDEYVDYAKAPMHQIIAKVKAGLETEPVFSK